MRAGVSRPLITISVFYLGIAIFPFVALYIELRLHAGDSLIGILSSEYMACRLLMGWVLGHVSDRWGPKASFGMTLVLFALGLVCCLTVHGRIPLLLCYFVTSTFVPGSIQLNMLAFEAAGQRPPIEATTTLVLFTGPAAVAGPLIAGAIIDRWSYPPAILTAAVCALISLIFLMRTPSGPAASKGAFDRHG